MAQVSQKDPKFCKQGDSVIVRIKMSRPICVEKYKDFTQMGRFMLRDQVIDGCNTLEYTAKHCETLQHAVTHCNTLQPRWAALC